MKKLLSILILLACCGFALGSNTITFTGNFSLNNTPTEADSATLYIYWYGVKVDSQDVTQEEADYDGMYTYSFDTDSGAHGWSGIWMFNKDADAVWLLDAAEIAYSSDSASATISTADKEEIAGINYDTMYVHADDFKGGTGTGSDPLIVYVLSSADSSAIYPATVTVNTKPDKTGSGFSAGTNGAGLRTFSLNAGDSIYYAAVASLYYIQPDTIVKGSGIEACTLLAVPQAISAPSDPSLCTVYGNLRSIAGNDSVDHAEVTFIWDHVVTDSAHGLILGNKKEVVYSDSTGFFQAQLFTTTALVPSDLKWRVEIYHSKEFKPKWKAEFKIPADSAGATFDLSSLKYDLSGY